MTAAWVPRRAGLRRALRRTALRASDTGPNAPHLVTGRE
jgi:hypothetical protein